MRIHRHCFTSPVALILGAVLSVTVFPPSAAAIDSIPEYFPLRPFNFDVSFNQRTFAPQARAIAVQAGLTALHYGLLEVRTIYQYQGQHTPTFMIDQHSLYVNPRWNNFIDIFDFPRDKPINRIIRHLLFGPLEEGLSSKTRKPARKSRPSFASRAGRPIRWRRSRKGCPA